MMNEDGNGESGAVEPVDDSAFIIPHSSFERPCLLVFRLLRYTAAASQQIRLAILV